MSEPIDPQLALMFSFYEGVFRKGPGSEESTLEALAMLELPPVPRVVDFGCGSGPAALVLARARECRVTAIDIHQPFLDELQSIAVRDGLAEQITVAQADMADPPFPDASFDLVWSEGAIYHVGFQEGLRRWRRLLPTGGHVAVTEVTWLSDNPPPQAAQFWQTEYPTITSIDGNLSKLHAAGFDPVGHFTLPTNDWANYYDPLQTHLATFLSTHPADHNTQALAESVQQEIDLWQTSGSSYGYVFYLGQAR